MKFGPFVVRTKSNLQNKSRETKKKLIKIRNFRAKPAFDKVDVF